MGVVTDVTVKGLTSAVTNISATGMSDTTGQAINSTLGTLGKDSSLQDIKTAINALANAISPAASNVTFDNTGTDLTASNVEAAIKQLNTVTTGTTGTGGFTLRKINHIVELKGNGVRADKLGSIPSDFKPAINTYIPVATIGDGSNHYYSGYLFIHGNTGEIDAMYINNGIGSKVTASNWIIYACAQYVS